MSGLSMNLITGRITISEFELLPDTNVYRRLEAKGHVPPFLLNIRVESLKVRGFESVRALRTKDIRVNRILIDEPWVSLIRMRLPDTVVVDTAAMMQSLSLPLPKGLNSIVVDLLKITKGKFRYTDIAKSPVRTIDVPDVDVEVRNFERTKEDRYTGRIFNSEDIAVVLNGFSFDTPDSIYTISFQKLAISSKNAAIIIDSVKVIPKITLTEFFKKLGYQTDRLEAKAEKVTVEGINYPSILLNNIFKASHILIDSITSEIYRDKRYPLRPGYHPPLPQDVLHDPGVLITIDSLSIRKSKVTYYEVVAEEPGMIFFDNINAKVYNISSDSSIWRERVMTATASAMLMGKGHLSAHFKIPLYAKNKSFSFSGTMSPPFDLTLINPMLTKLFPARIMKGQLDRLIIRNVEANDDVSSGNLVFLYHDLNLELSKENDITTWQKIKTGAMNIAANIVIINANPSGGNLRQGIIHFERDKTKGFFNFLWKSTFSGLKSSMGFNDKSQREIKKEKRQEKRDQKKQKK
jgi:hypothetical protein